MNKFHPDWKDDDPTDDNMDELMKDGMNVWYAEVTNPVIK